MDPVPAPETVGRYRVLGTLGRGGMGVVYRAMDERLDREVALKMLPQDRSADAEAHQRLLTEARAAARLDHPHVCTIYEVGEADDGRAFLALARYSGKTLRERLAQGPLAPEEAAALGRQVASALGAAHDRGIVHRDLKPANVFLCDEDRLHAKVLDFGIAKMEGVDLTRTGHTSGTLYYAAPEQTAGHADARSDLWSLGVVLYEALAGRRPFEGSYEAATLYAILNEPPAPLPESVPRPLAAVVMRLLEKAPEARYASAQEAEAALARATGETPAASGDVPVGTIPRDTPAYAMQQAPSRPRWVRWAAGAVAAIALALGGVLGAPLLFSDAAPEARAHRLAVFPFGAPGADSLDTALADGLAPSLTSEIIEAAPTPDAVHLVPSSEVREAGVSTVAAAADVLGATAVVRGTLRRVGDSLAVDLEVVDARTTRLLASSTVGAPGAEPGRLVAAAVSVVSDALGLGADAVRIAAQQVTAPEAYGPYLQGLGYLEQPATPASVRTAVTFFEEAAALDPDSPFVRAGLAQAVYREFVLTYDVDLLERAEAEARRVLDLAGEEAPHAAALAHITLASGAMERGRYPEAIEEARQAVVLAPGLDATRRTLGRAYEKASRPADAERELREAAALRPDSWAAQNTLGSFYFNQGRYEEAQEAFEEATRLVPDDATAHFNLGATLYNATGVDSVAIPHFEASIGLRPTALALSNLANVHFFAERFREAADLYREALDLDPTDVYSWGSLHTALDELGKDAESQNALERAVEAADAKLRVNPNNASLLAFAAVCNATLGQDTKARQLIERALIYGRDDPYVLKDAATTYEMIGDAPEAERWRRAAAE